MLDKQQKIKDISTFLEDNEGINSQQVLAISHDDTEGDENMDEYKKLSRAEFIMAQVNLEVIESHGSQELQMSTQQVHLRKLL